MMSSILGKLKPGGYGGSAEKTATFAQRNGEIVLKELIAASNGKHNPFRIFYDQELKIATNNYDREKIIKRDGSYILYEGILQEQLISVMKFRDDKDNSYECCIKNIVYASQMCHNHILRLIGCCLETQIPILVFESAELGILVDRIHGTPQPHFEPLLLTDRLKIAMDIAHAVAYLHFGFRRPIVFRAINSSNILFHEENIAKLFDFSISESIPEGETCIKDKDKVIGTLGYLAPEYFATSECNEKCDVYSFGVLLHELLTGQKVCDNARADNGGEGHLIRHVKNYVENDRFNEVIDPIIVEDWLCPQKKQQLQAFAELMFECVNIFPEDRPTMIDVAKQLKHLYRSCMQF